MIRIMLIILRQILLPKKHGAGSPLNNYVPYERAQPYGSCEHLFVLVFGSGLGVTLNYEMHSTSVLVLMEILTV